MARMARIEFQGKINDVSLAPNIENFQANVNGSAVHSASLMAQLHAHAQRLIPLTQVRLYVVGVALRTGLRFCGDCLA